MIRTLERVGEPHRPDQSSRWNPNMVSPAELAEYIRLLKAECEREPQNADLHTCLGIALARNEQLAEAMASLDAAVRVAPHHFFAHYQRAELHVKMSCPLDALSESRKAFALARTKWQSAMAKRQLAALQAQRRAACPPSLFPEALAISALLMGVALFIVVNR